MSQRVSHRDEQPTSTGFSATYWLASPKREEFFGPLGVTNIRTFVDPHNPNHVALLMDVRDIEAFNTAMQAQEAAEAMAHDGVLTEKHW